MTDSEQDDGGKVEDLFRRAAFNWVQSTKRLVESSAALGPKTRVAYAALADIEHARDLLKDLFMPVASKTPAAFADQVNPITASDVRSAVSDVAKRITSQVQEVRKTPFNSRVEVRKDPSVAAQVQAHVDDIIGSPPIVRHGQPRAEDPVRPPLGLDIGCWPPVSGWDGQVDHAGQGVTPPPLVPEPKPQRRESKPLSRQAHHKADLSAPVYPKGGRMLWAGVDCPVCPSVAGQRCQKDETAFGTFIEKPHPERKTVSEAMEIATALVNNVEQNTV